LTLHPEAKGPGRYLVRAKNTEYMAGDPERRPVLVAESLAMVMP